MNRREAISSVAWLLGGTVLGADLFLNYACTPASKDVSALFEKDYLAFLDEVADTILPETSTPGAKDAEVGQFMAVMVRDCYTPEDQKVFINGISEIDKTADKKFGKKFMELDAKQRTDLLKELDIAQRDYQEKKEKEDPNHYFRMMKELTLLGYFTSKVGATQALRYLPVPGRYEGCVPYKKGEKAWAT